ncbi:MAG: adenine deaminase [Desulfobacteraceae bacterium]|nr:adenine deaminase [Desulfobacteraceae bacterium]
MNTKKLIRYASGKKPVELLLKHCRVLNVYNGEILRTHIAIQYGFIVGMGDYEADTTEDLKGRFVAPGLIDAHVHIESSMICPGEFARTVAARGTTAVIADPHEIANVLGSEGISYMLRAAENQPMDLYFALPSCVPASSMETSGAALTDKDLARFLPHPRIVALGEMMNFPGVVMEDELVMRKLDLAKQNRLVLDGHAPGLFGKGLNAYITAGMASDHECTTLKEAQEKLAAGMHIMVREGTGARNLEDLLPMINHQTARRMMWCTDDRHPHDLLGNGHMDAILRKAMGLGLDPVMAFQMATLNPAEYFGLQDMGAIAPGKRANLMVFSDLHSPRAEKVYFNGIPVAENGFILPNIEKIPPEPISNSINLEPGHLNFSIPAISSRIHLMELVKDQILTRHTLETVSTDGKGFAVSDLSRDILKIAVVERHKKTGNIGLGFVKGFGLKGGALASSVAHDSHNIIVVGINDEDMNAAVMEIIHMGGGMAVVNNGLTITSLPLPVAGLISMEPIETVRSQLDALLLAAKSLGADMSDPFMALSFLALPVIPELKITDQGLVDVRAFKIIPLFV